MPDWFLLWPAPLVVFAAAVSVARPRWVHEIGFLALVATLAWVHLVPAGYTLPLQLFGFDVAVIYVDPFSRLMGYVFALIGLAAVAYSRSSDGSPRLAGYALAYVGSSLGAVFAGDWLTLLLFWEAMAVTSTLLVWEHGGRAVRAGYRYAIVHGIGGSLLMGGIIVHYTEAGTFLFEATPGITWGLPAVLAATGIGVNLGFVGLHAWLPDTYPRPHVAASVFLCVYTTKTGVYALARAFPDGHLWIAYMGGAMALYGVTLALIQNDMRRLLSYHIQSQVGYMVAGVGIGGALATAGAMAHVFNHILYKSLLFMTVGVIIYRTGVENLKKLGGLYRVMPITFVAYTIAALSIAGFPGFNGFVSKGMVIEAAHYQHLDLLWWALIIAGVGTFMSFIKLGYYAFLGSPITTDVDDAKPGQTVAMVSVAGLCVLLGVAPVLLYPALPAGGSLDYVAYTVDHVVEGAVIGIVGLLAFVAIKRPLKRTPTVPDIDLTYNPFTAWGIRRTIDGVSALAHLGETVAGRGTGLVVRTTFSDPVVIGRSTERPGLPRMRTSSSIGTALLLIAASILVGMLILLRQFG